MSETSTPQSNRRTVVLLAVAVLIGAVILLIAVEMGAFLGTKPAAPAEAPKSGGAEITAFPVASAVASEPNVG